jgi:hypothetical protein
LRSFHNRRLHFIFQWLIFFVLYSVQWYTALLIKVVAYLLALRLQAHRPFSKLTITQIMRKLSRDHDLKDVLTTHFHVAFLTT